MKNSHYLTAVSYMLLSATGLAFTGLLAKIGFEGLSLQALIFWRFFSAFAVCFLVFFFSRRVRWSFAWPDFKMHALRSLFVLASQYCFYYFLEFDTLLNAVVLLNTGPLFIPLIERFALGKNVERSTWIGLFISFLGVLCVLQPGEDIFSSLSLIGVLAGLSQGSSQVVFGMNSKRENSQLGVLILFGLCALASLIPYAFTAVFSMQKTLFSTRDLWVILSLGISSVCNQIFRASAYELGSPSKLAAFLYFSVILAGFFDWAFFDRVPNELSIAGALLVLLGGLFKMFFHFRANRSR